MAREGQGISLRLSGMLRCLTPLPSSSSRPTFMQLSSDAVLREAFTDGVASQRHIHLDHLQALGPSKAGR